MEEKTFYTYMLLTEHGTYYCGYTDDIEKRYKKHCDGLGAKYTRANKPIKIAFLESFNDKSSAMKEEIRIKNLKRMEKENLINNFIKNASELYNLARKITLQNI